MKIIRHELIDWEPFHLCVVFRKATPDADARVRRVVNEFLAERRSAGLCGCGTKHVYVAPESDPKRVHIAIQWACDRCLEVLIERIEAALPEVRQVELGVPFTEPAPPIGILVRVSEKNVELEDGTRERVAPFLIAKYPVTVGEMETFCEATGYQTTAELAHDANTFRSFPRKRGLPERAWSSSVIYIVSYLDAEAYCRWVGARLPSEREWVAASVLDERTYDPKTELDLLYDPTTGRSRWANHPDRLEGGGVEWTGTVLHGRRAVLRSGPRPVLTVGWNDGGGRFRRLQPLEYFDPLTTFRICRSLPDEEHQED